MLKSSNLDNDFKKNCVVREISLNLLCRSNNLVEILDFAANDKVCFLVFEFID